ncbi:hypothetical protein FGO68_gene2905 [Halteria grandinella]|uniref:Uncharacterized protein n=1 Tax=Halteria grandinella TaxID=5974 RepID=A0A8J8T325_HALGN|nr:hypothetical protein FGO68_gene2905 [Halteria grandinella]
MGTEYIQLPISHELIRAVSGFELTTTLMFAVIPELFYNYGPRNMTLDVALSLDINQTTNAVQVQLTNLTLSGFNVTLDNLGGSIKSDEAGILYRLGFDPPPRVQRPQVHREVRLPRQRLRRWHDGRAQVSHVT